MKAKYVNPFTDYGFKKIFGEEASKPALIDFLNSLLPKTGEGTIKDLKFKNSEQLSESAEDRKAVFDIYCENEKGEKFIVELQKARQNFFKERTIYYSTFPIREQVEKGDWDFDLKAVYCIGILDFIFKDYKENEPEIKQVVHTVKLKDQNGKIFYDKLTYIYLEMPKFNKTESDLENRLDKWLYFIKNLEDLQSIPQIFANDIVFKTAFEKAEISRFTMEEYHNYESSVKVYRDWHNVIETAKQESERKGKTEGKIEGKMEVAKSLKENGIAISIISKTTGLSENEIQNL